MNDIQNSNTVKSIIDNVKKMLLSTSIHQLRIVMVLSYCNISQSKFFNLFGSISVLIELIVLEELLYSYSLISKQIISEKEMKQNYDIRLLRQIYIKANPVLDNYHRNKGLLPSRFRKVKAAILQKELELVSTIVFNTYKSPLDEIEYLKIMKDIEA